MLLPAPGGQVREMRAHMPTQSNSLVVSTHDPPAYESDAALTDAAVTPHRYVLVDSKYVQIIERINKVLFVEDKKG
jgi:hypothetical protein